MLNKPIRYLDCPELLDIPKKAPTYQKKTQTLLRLPTTEEIGSTLNTYVKDNDGIRLESSRQIDENSVIARNPEPLASDDNACTKYNEWVISKDTAQKNYGNAATESLTEKFQPYTKLSKVHAIELTQNVLDMLNAIGDELHIPVTWSDSPMIAKIGDFITLDGHSISRHDMRSYKIARDDELQYSPNQK